MFLAGVLLETLNKIKCGPDGILTQLQATQMKATDVDRIVLDLILAAGDTASFLSFF